MRTNILNPLQFVLPVSAKIMLLLLVLIYGAFNFSAHHWILLGLLIVAVLAISDRISRLTAQYKKHTTNHTAISTDGGTFSHTEKNNRTRTGYAVVKDGGLFKRK